MDADRSEGRWDGVSLARALSKLGCCSRSQARILIEAGRVEVNGDLQRDPVSRVDLRSDRITLDGRRVGQVQKVALMLNKPRGLVTTRSDEQGRDTVYQCLNARSLPWVFPVGRLDKASEGLLLFTNDTAWAERVCSPESHVPKVYHAQIDRLLDAESIQRMKDGILVAGGDLLKATDVRPLRSGKRRMWTEIVLEEGKNRHIRRLLDALGVETLRLIRVAIGPLRLGDLKKGDFRFLTTAERESLVR